MTLCDLGRYARHILLLVVVVWAEAGWAQVRPASKPVSLFVLPSQTCTENATEVLVARVFQCGADLRGAVAEMPADGNRGKKASQEYVAEMVAGMAKAGASNLVIKRSPDEKLRAAEIEFTKPGGWLGITHAYIRTSTALVVTIEYQDRRGKRRAQKALSTYRKALQKAEEI